MWTDEMSEDDLDDYNALLQAVTSGQKDWLARLALADWMEQHGFREEAGFWRVAGEQLRELVKWVK